MIGTRLFAHYRNNYRLWKQYKGIHKSYHQPLRFFPSETYFKYPPQHDFEGRKVLNFGCGKSIYPAPNVSNVDIAPDTGVLVRDLSKPLSQFGIDFDLVLANHVLEHVPDWYEAFKEMTAIVKVGGRIEIYVPPVSSDTAFTYRDHINRIGVRSFNSVGQSVHAGSNLFVGQEMEKEQFLRNFVIRSYSRRPCLTWWMLLAWPSLALWMTEHLRNVVSEEGFVFERVR